MIRLEKSSYSKAIEPLERVTINNLFARSVVENHVTGSVYVDNEEAPKTFYVVHPYNMSLLFGDCNNEKFNADFREYALNVNRVRNKYEWMQAFPASWDAVLSNLFADCMVKAADNLKNDKSGIIELNTRINFKFNVDNYQNFKQKSITGDFKIIRTNKKIYEEMKGSVVPSNFWNNAEQFYKHGIGFSLIYEGKLASTAYSSFMHDDKLEIGIETIEEFRDKGFAQYACGALIDYCLDNHYEPIWACRLENTGSYKLAQKLGFEVALNIPYYRLSN